MIMDDEPTDEFDGKVIYQTELAWLFWVEDADEEIWFPKSQCDLDFTSTTITVPRWLAKAKGL